jgi:hypothetical protein
MCSLTASRISDVYPGYICSRLHMSLVFRGTTCSILLFPLFW